MFLSSTAAPGNGGPLLPPRGQTSVLYSVPAPADPAKQAEARQRSAAAIEAAQRRGAAGAAAHEGDAAAAGGAELGAEAEPARQPAQGSEQR
jgi:hypothetical protein